MFAKFDMDEIEVLMVLYFLGQIRTGDDQGPDPGLD